MRRFYLAALGMLFAIPAWAGPYSATGIPYNDPAFVGWATGFENLVRGPQNISVPGSPAVTFGTGNNGLGVANGGSGVVSLGDGGSITLTFARPIVNGPGADFAVFENGFAFQGVFAELGFVEVSSDGVNFVRFPSVSLTQTATQLTNANGLDPTDIHNLAGQFVAKTGTPFDLADVGMSSVNYVRIVDVVGSIDPQFGTKDSLGNLINDPFSTPFASGGFDLDAVGVINQAPEPCSLLLLGVGAVGLGMARFRRRASHD